MAAELCGQAAKPLMVLRVQVCEWSPQASRWRDGKLLRLLQVACVKPLGEPLIDRREQVVSGLALALLLPQPRQAGGGAQCEAVGD